MIAQHHFLSTKYHAPADGELIQDLYSRNLSYCGDPNCHSADLLVLFLDLSLEWMHVSLDWIAVVLAMFVRYRVSERRGIHGKFNTSITLSIPPYELIGSE